MNGRPRLRPAPGRAPDLARRSVQFLVGVAGMGLGVATMLEANIGVGPWSVFHDGLARVTPLSFGQTVVVVGVGVALLAWRWTGQRPGAGTVLNMLLVGPFIDLFRASGLVPAQDALLPGIVQLLAGVAILGTATGMYIGARFGAGPRDGFVLGLARVLKRSVRQVRTGLELTVLVLGAVLGGSVGLGTLLFALTIGPSMQVSLRLFRQRAPATAAGD
jgi:uncharacterized membrane protein YczE